MTIIMTKKSYRNNVLVETETYTIDKHQYCNITDPGTLAWFRSLGGSETATRDYTPLGYAPVRLTSRSPDRVQKVVRDFEIRE